MIWSQTIIPNIVTYYTIVKKNLMIFKSKSYKHFSASRVMRRSVNQVMRFPCWYLIELKINIFSECKSSMFAWRRVGHLDRLLWMFEGAAAPGTLEIKIFTRTVYFNTEKYRFQIQCNVVDPSDVSLYIYLVGKFQNIFTIKHQTKSIIIYSNYTR